MIAPIFFFSFTLIAISYAPWFSWTEHALSHLGGEPGETPIWAARGTASILFNSGLVVTGSFGTVFAIGLRKIQKTPAGRLGATLFISDMVALCLVGVFPLSVGLPHGIASFLLFLLAPLSLWMLGAGYLDSSERACGIFSILTGIITVVGLLVVPVVFELEGIAIPEMIFAAALSLYSIVFGFRIGTLRQAEV